MEIYNGMRLNDDVPRGAKNFFKNASERMLSCNTVRIEEASYGYVKVKAHVTEDTKNPYGFVHGGVVFVLCDNCAGATAATLGAKAVTLNSSINYLKSATSGFIHAEPTVIHHGSSTIVLGVDVKDDNGTLIAKSTFTMFVIGSIVEYEDKEDKDE